MCCQSCVIYRVCCQAPAAEPKCQVERDPYQCLCVEREKTRWREWERRQLFKGHILYFCSIFPLWSPLFMLVKLSWNQNTSNFVLQDHFRQSVLLRWDTTNYLYVHIEHKNGVWWDIKNSQSEQLNLFAHSHTLFLFFVAYEAFEIFNIW